MNKKIAIIGCGWLGFPLAQRLIKEGMTVHGSTTSEEKLDILKKSEIVPFHISLSENKVHGDVRAFLKDVDTIIINVPPKLRGGNKENYIKKMQLLHGSIKDSKLKKVVFASSTSVYGASEGEVDEETDPQPVTESGKQLLASEKAFKDDDGLQTTIVRFGGLIGGNRHPVKMLSGKSDLANGNHPINLIHLDDCIEIMTSIIKKGWWNETFNAVYPYHPPKKEYYLQEAEKRRLKPPHYSADNQSIGKIIRSNRLISVKNHVFTTTL